MKATIKANANIALIKYWGKRDKELMLPHNGSISFTLDCFNATTTVEFDNKYEQDTLILNDEEIVPGTPDYDDYIGKFIQHVREMSGVQAKIKIVSQNNFPTAAGLASSAAGFAALASAINQALELNLDDKQLSMLARRGSGSATRSVLGGFVEWKRGEKDDGTDSFAEQLASQDHWPEFRMIACITSAKAKKIKSRAGMSQTVATSPMYQGWLDSIDQNLNTVRQAILDKDFSTVGETAEHNALKMHATMMSTTPAIIYWNETTIALMHKIMDLRDEGLESYFTMDAGPQVKVLCLEKDVDQLVSHFKDVPGIEKLIVAKAGGPPEVLSEHLF